MAYSRSFLLFSTFVLEKIFNLMTLKKTMLQYNAIFLSIEESCLFHSFMKNLELNLNSRIGRSKQRLATITN